MSDPFCGGGFSNCGKYTVNTTCNGDTACAWIKDPFSGYNYCDVKGALCWSYDDNETGCNVTTGCRWSTGGFGGMASSFCDVNETRFEPCFMINNQTGCGANNNCTWKQDMFHGGGSGFCDAKPFSCLDTYFGNSTGCDADQNCKWTIDSFSPGGGRCEAVCWSLNSSACASNPICESRAGFCDPESFNVGGCFQLDGNQTGCQNVSGCVWQPDSFYPNDTLGKPDKGWCQDSF